MNFSWRLESIPTVLPDEQRVPGIQEVNQEKGGRDGPLNKTQMET